MKQMYEQMLTVMVNRKRDSNLYLIEIWKVEAWENAWEKPFLTPYKHCI